SRKYTSLCVKIRLHFCPVLLLYFPHVCSLSQTTYSHACFPISCMDSTCSVISPEQRAGGGWSRMREKRAGPVGFHLWSCQVGLFLYMQSLLSPADFGTSCLFLHHT
uniref:Uncharacterized protein n=1 Tax=Otus sunia TaxID=257818 RepID=A0A8C8EBX5_9STRI